MIQWFKMVTLEVFNYIDLSEKVIDMHDFSGIIFTLKSMLYMQTSTQESLHRNCRFIDDFTVS